MQSVVCSVTFLKSAQNDHPVLLIPHRTGHSVPVWILVEILTLSLQQYFPFTVKHTFCPFNLYSSLKGRGDLLGVTHVPAAVRVTSLVLSHVSLHHVDPVSLGKKSQLHFADEETALGR